MEKDKNTLWMRYACGAGSAAGLIFVFTFQHLNFSQWLTKDDVWQFFINRTFRFLLNDSLTIILIWALFGQKRFVLFSLWVQLFGFVFILMPYFILKVYFPAYNGPLLSFIHRLILNPTLLLLLVPSFYYQKYITGKFQKEI